MTAPRNEILISYSRCDLFWKEQLLTHLAPLVRGRNLNVWDDGKIKPGSRWRDEIRSALRRARVAVLLVSPEFLASDFIATHELEPLLKAAGAEGLRILWVAVSASIVSETEIVEYEALYEPAMPLDKWKQKTSTLNGILADIAKKILKAYQEAHDVRAPAQHRASSGEVDLDLAEAQNTKRWVLDCALASRLFVNERRELRLVIRQEQFPGLSQYASEDSKVRKGERAYDFTGKDVRSVPFDVDFPVLSQCARPVELEIDLDALNFRVTERLPRTVLLSPTTDSHTEVFIVGAKKPGRLILVVKVLCDWASLASETLRTFAADIDRSPPGAPRVLAQLALEAEAVGARHATA
jgi:hypothetical protein